MEICLGVFVSCTTKINVSQAHIRWFYEQLSVSISIYLRTLSSKERGHVRNLVISFINWITQTEISTLIIKHYNAIFTPFQLRSHTWRHCRPYNALIDTNCVTRRRQVHRLRYFNVKASSHLSRHTVAVKMLCLLVKFNLDIHHNRRVSEDRHWLKDRPLMPETRSSAK